VSAAFTPWFPADEAPVRDGVYQVLIRERVKYARWRSGQWHLALDLFERAKRSGIKSTDCYSAKFGGWRGLAKPTKRSK
jgi:hypothetical protein